MNQRYLHLISVLFYVVLFASSNLYAQNNYTVKDITPMYTVFIGMNQQGFCGPETNSGWFEKCELEAGFNTFQLYSVKELGPSLGFFRDGYLMPQPQIWGEGDIQSFSLCPDYDGEEQHNSVTLGPKPFKPSIRITGMEDIAPSGITGDTGKHLLLYFQTGSAEDGGIIMEWQSNVGIGKLGERFGGFEITFSVGWKSLMRGLEFEVGAIHEDEGEIQNWTMRFIPKNE